MISVLVLFNIIDTLTAYVRFLLIDIIFPYATIFYR